MAKCTILGPFHVI